MRLMKTIAYCNPFVPAEWIRAHGLRPHWMQMPHVEHRAPRGAVCGVCPYAQAFLEAVGSGAACTAIVVTTTCDQMRHAAALLDAAPGPPIFLMNVPATWQTVLARDLYRSELERLGRFLVSLGGSTPSRDHLRGVMVGYDRARSRLRANRDGLSTRQYARALMTLSEEGFAKTGGLDPDSGRRENGSVPLALVGGPLTEPDQTIFDMIEEAGGRVVLNGTEGGERTMPAAFDHQELRHDPLGELVRAYFGTIPDPFRKPSHGLREWLQTQLSERQARGIVFWRFAWCDTWHAELARWQERSPVPVLDLETGHSGDGLWARLAGRLDAFVEMLR